MQMLSRTRNSTVLVGALLLASHFAFAGCEVVANAEIPIFVQSSGNLRFSARRDGQPASYVLVGISKYGAAAPYMRFAADENGAVAPPPLPAGDYEVYALAADGSAASLLIRVSGGAAEEISTFEMALRLGRFRPDVVAEVADAQRFNGVVRDATGAEVPHATILVVGQKGSISSAVIQLSSGNDGRFATYLPNGQYVAFFSSPGFRMKIVHFVISAQGAENLPVRLNIGPSC
jgi:carboxypeptidase family protein